MIYSITGNDTLTVWGRTFNELADGDTSAIVFPTDSVSGKTGKNKNTIFAKNEQGGNAELTLRVMRGSSDDKFLQKKVALMEKDFASFELANGSFTKRLGDGDGNVTRDVYILKGGIFKRFVDGRENVDGATDQNVAIYTMLFAYAKRENQ